MAETVPSDTAYILIVETNIHIKKSNNFIYKKVIWKESKLICFSISCALQTFLSKNWHSSFALEGGKKYIHKLIEENMPCKKSSRQWDLLWWNLYWLEYSSL